MYRGKIDHRFNIFDESRIHTCIKNQTWFAASSYNNTIFGIQGVFNNINFFLYCFDKKPSGEYFDVQIPELEKNESILPVSTRFSTNSVLFIMKTEITGKTSTRVYTISQDDGQILSHYRVEALPSDTHRNIHGKAFIGPSGTRGLILHATDDGIVQEKIGDNKIEKQLLLSETEQFVAETDSLIYYKKGILVIGDRG